MPTLRRMSNGLPGALIVVTSLYLGMEAAAQTSSDPKVMTLTPGKQYVLDFSGSQDGGIPGGNFDNFAFNIDLKEPLRKISVKYGEQRKDVIATYDYAGCLRGQESLLEKPLRSLAPGSATWVDYVDVEMLPLRQKDVRWAGGVCYGYRTPSGTWHWRLASTPLTYDPATDRVRARIWVKEANIDALKLVFDSSVPRQSVRTVTVTTQPGIK